MVDPGGEAAVGAVVHIDPYGSERSGRIEWSTPLADHFRVTDAQGRASFAFEPGPGAHSVVVARPGELGVGEIEHAGELIIELQPDSGPE